MSCKPDLACKPGFAAITNNPSPNVWGPGCKTMVNGVLQCDQHFANQYNRFQNFMHGSSELQKTGCSNCFGNIERKEYICPQVGPGNPYLNSNPRGRDCFNQPPNNLGAHRVCFRDSLPGQSDLPSYNGFSAFFPGFPGNQNGGSNASGNQKYLGNQDGVSKSDQRRKEQTGGAFSAFPSAIDVDINDPVYNQCETVVHLTPSYLEGPTYGNLADTCNLRTNYRPSKQPGLDVSTVRLPGPQTGPVMQTSLCGDRQRCGNGACAPTQTSSLDSCLTGCKKIALAGPCQTGGNSTCAWDDRVLTSPWVYGQGTADIPTYYFDLSAETVGARPQFRAGTNNSIPPMMLINQTNLLGKQFGCRQPCWQSNCL